MIRQLTGSDVVHFDDGSRPGMVDAHILHRDGSTAALEVTTVPAPEAMQMESFDIHLDIPNSPSWWDIRYPGWSLRRREADPHILALVAHMDSGGLDNSDLLGGTISGSPEAAWIERTGVEIRRLGLRPEGGRAAILPGASGGFVDQRLQGLTDWVEGVQGEAWWIENVEKLARSPHREKHLAVLMHEAAVPFAIAMGLWDATRIDAPEPTGMHPLTDLWLLGRQRQNVVRWRAGTGWTAHLFTTNLERP